MTKTAQLAVSRGLAELCAGTGVTVNAVLPGPTHSDGVETFVKQLSGGKPFADVDFLLKSVKQMNQKAAVQTADGRK